MALRLHEGQVDAVADDDYTTAELVRTMKMMREEMNSQLVGLGARFDNYLLTAVYAAEKKAIDAEMLVLRRDISELQQANQWITRIVVLFVVSAVLAAVFGTAAIK